MDDHAPDASPQGEAHHDDPDVNAATAVPVEPASIEGLPIVEPTISPRQSDIENENLDNTKTPEGLDPLRPEVEPTPVSDLPEMIMTDIEAEHGRSAEDGNPKPAVPSSTDLRSEALRVGKGCVSTVRTPRSAAQ